MSVFKIITNMFTLYYLNWIVLLLSYFGSIICILYMQTPYIILYFIIQIFINLINLNFKIRKYKVILSRLVIFLNLFVLKTGIIMLFVIPLNTLIDIILFDIVFINSSLYFFMIYEYYYTKIIY